MKRVALLLLVCACLLGITAVALGQANAATNKPGFGAPTTATAIPGFYNPSTGLFTVRAATGANPQPDVQAALAGTSLFFREDFHITIWNFDQSPSAQVVCSANIATGDTNGVFEDGDSVLATYSGGAWTCDVPVLTLWTLQNPGTDVMSGGVTVEIGSGSSLGVPLRTSSQSVALTIPGNTQTVVNNVTFQL